MESFLPFQNFKHGEDRKGRGKCKRKEENAYSVDQQVMMKEFITNLTKEKFGLKNTRLKCILETLCNLLLYLSRKFIFPSSSFVLNAWVQRAYRGYCHKTQKFNA